MNFNCRRGPEEHHGCQQGIFRNWYPLVLDQARGGYFINVMWDSQFGGFYQIRSREGGYSGVRGWREEKRTYGNAFSRLMQEAETLGFAQEVFAWIEDLAFDPKYKGYFQFLTREGVPIDALSPYKTVAADSNELGFKDQNSSIHLLELIRDTMVTERGYLQLFFQPDWSPVSFRDAPPQERMKNYDLALLIDERRVDVGIGRRKHEIQDLINHWKKEA